MRSNFNVPAQPVLPLLYPVLLHADPSMCCANLPSYARAQHGLEKSVQTRSEKGFFRAGWQLAPDELLGLEGPGSHSAGQALHTITPSAPSECHAPPGSCPLAVSLSVWGAGAFLCQLCRCSQTAYQCRCFFARAEITSISADPKV